MEYYLEKITPHRTARLWLYNCKNEILLQTFDSLSGWGRVAALADNTLSWEFNVNMIPAIEKIIFYYQIAEKTF